MKAKDPFNQLFSDILILKNKPLTLLLGIFIPFFSCHIFGILSKRNKTNYIWGFLPSFLIVSTFYILIIFPGLIPNISLIGFIQENLLLIFICCLDINIISTFFAELNLEYPHLKIN